MISQSIYREKIEELTFFKSKPISSEFLLNWLNRNWDLYLKTSEFNSCSNRQNSFPCFCCIKKEDCLFIKIFSELHIIENYNSYNLKSKKVLQEYDNINDNKEALKKWTKNNYDLAINKLASFDNYEGKRKIRRSFINGKNKITNEFDYIFIYISLKKFEHNYELKKVFNELFFIDKILPKELREYTTKLNKIYD